MNTTLIIKIMADYSMIPIVLIAAYALIFKINPKRRLKSYSLILVAAMTSYLLAQLIAIIYQPEALRPFQLLGSSAGASFLNNAGFPSDHLLFATVLTAAVWFETKQKGLTAAMAVLLIIVGVGRVLALVHSPADVIGGIVIGLLGAVWYLNDKEPRGKNNIKKH